MAFFLIINLEIFIIFYLSLVDKKMVPIENYGVKCMSMGLLVETDAAFVWRGPMVCLPCYQCLLEDAFVLTPFFIFQMSMVLYV